MAYTRPDGVKIIPLGCLKDQPFKKAKFHFHERIVARDEVKADGGIREPEEGFDLRKLCQGGGLFPKECVQRAYAFPYFLTYADFRFAAVGKSGLTGHVAL